MSATNAPPVSAEELFGIAARLRREGKRCELVRGEVHDMTPAGYLHGLVAGRIFAAIDGFARERNLGQVMAAETGFRLEKSPDTVRAPDVAFVSAERAPEQPPTGYADFAPDLVVEVVSPGDEFSDVEEKALCWIRHGVRAVWIVDPGNRTALLHREDGSVTHASEDDPLDGGDVLPGFSLRLGDALA